MLLPITWMRDFVEIDEDAVTIGDRLSLTGSHVEEITDPGRGLDGIVTAKVLERKKHPNADRLQLITLDYGGDEPVTIVTGADNIETGDRVVYAKTGAVMPSGLEIKPIKLKGIKSVGMLCSYEELGYPENTVPKNSQNGVIILSADIPVGTDVRKALESEHDIFDIEITPNRPDCLSIAGMSREAAATFGKRIDVPEVSYEEKGDIGDYFDDIEIETDGCQRYCARVCTDITVGESPQWIKNRLMQAGMRPVNNIVDITNFVMLETGQPIHAFDIDMLPQRRIVVRDAKDKEKMKTLDGKERTFTKDDVLITDGEKPVAIAGVMGGLDSEVEDHTKTVLIESANFDKSRVRKTSKRLALRTEASTRFEKGANPYLADYASRRVCQLIEETGAGTVVGGAVDRFPKKEEPATVTIRPERFSEILGTQISAEEAKRYLELLEFKVEEKDDGFVVTVPRHRDDVRIPEDLAEEVGRLYGFYRIEPKPLTGTIHRGTKSKKRRYTDQVKKLFYGLGYSEIMTYSFVSRKSYKKIRKEVPEDIITIENPLGEDFSVMRTDLLSNMLGALERNASNHIEEVKFFEVGNTFREEGGDRKQEVKLVLGAYGTDTGFFEMKADIVRFFEETGISDLRFEKEEDNRTFHPGRCAGVYLGDEKLGVFGELNYEIIKKQRFVHRPYMAQFDLETAGKHADFSKIYTPIIRYPKIERDLALVVPKTETSETIEKTIKETSDLIREVELFDVYEGEHVEEGYRSLAYKIIYQDENGTLKDEEVSAVQEKLLQRLEDAGIELRKQ